LLTFIPVEIWLGFDTVHCTQRWCPRPRCWQTLSLSSSTKMTEYSLRLRLCTRTPPGVSTLN